MVLLPEEREMTLAELRQIAARQQHQIEAQQQLLAAKKQRLKFLKQQEAHNHNLTEQHLDSSCLVTLRDKVENQELKLRQLRSLRGQVEQQKTNNSNLGTELDSVRALFSEKEKELDLAVSKVEELSRQLDEIRKNSKKNYVISTSPDFENLQRRLNCHTEISEQQNNYITQQREKIHCKQQDIATLDQKINELNKRLHRKRLLNEQFASQIHLASLSLNSNCSSLNDNLLLKTDTRVQEILENEQTRDDLAASLHGFQKFGFGEFSLTKKDPKYQTLPYNTKFTLKERQLEDFSSSSTEDESNSSKTDTPKEMKVLKTSANMCNFSPRPFNNAFNCNSGVQKVSLHIGSTTNSNNLQDSEPITNKVINNEDVQKSKEVDVPPSNVSNCQELPPSKPNQPVANSLVQPKSVKPAVPPKPALSVKPMLASADRGRLQQKKKDPLEHDTVNMALMFLKNKSSEKEKNDFSNYKNRLLYYQCIPRYSGAKESASQDPLLPKSRILTYFSKTLLQPEVGSRNQTEANDSGENSKRRLPFEPIKPKPLTIRKNPSIEPPKLKVHSLNSSSSLHQRSSESQLLLFSSKQPKTLTSTTKDESVESVPSIDSPDHAIHKNQNKIETVVFQGSLDENQNSDACMKDSEENEVADGEAECSSDQSDSSDVNKTDSSLTDGLKKGNLKVDSSVRTSRRVSFDPLALLLDAALEGELELVKKIATEVVNPSAANDEGITALHNAICAGQFDVVKFLVEFGCDVNSPDSDGWTPLHCAASCNNLAMVKFLVERGACIFATTLSDQETAAEKCEEDGAGFDGCSEYLYSLQDNLGIMNDGIVYAVYDYDVQNADELSFKNGDMLTVLRRSDDEENEWWWCRLNDQEGYVPRNLLGLYPRINASSGKPS